MTPAGLSAALTSRYEWVSRVSPTRDYTEPSLIMFRAVTI
jgi:hypothetical protein